MSMKMNISGSGVFGGRLGRNEAGPRSLWTSMKRLMGYLKKSGILIAFTLFMAVAGSLMLLLTPKMLGSATTLIFQGIRTGSGIDFAALLTILVWVGLLYLGAFLTSFLQERLMTVVSLKTTEALRNAVKAKLNRVPISYFDRNSTGDLMSLAVNDIDNIAQNLQQSLTQLISSAILVVGILAVMLTISPVLTLLACAIIPASIIIAKLFTPIAQRNNKRYFESLGTLNGSVEETYHNFVVVKSFQGEKAALEEFRKANRDMCESGWRAKFFGQSMKHFMMLVRISFMC